MPADVVHVGGEDAAGRDGLAHGLVVAVVAPDDHLVGDAGEGRDVAAVLVQQEGEVLARLEVLLLDDVVVPRQRVHLRVVVGRRLHDLAAGRVSRQDREANAAKQARACRRMTCSLCQTLCACSSGKRLVPMAGAAKWSSCTKSIRYCDGLSSCTARR